MASTDYSKAAEAIAAIIAKAEDTQGAATVAGRAVQQTLRGHFAKLNQRPDRKGWAKSGFWSDIRGSVVQIPLTAAGLGWSKEYGLRVQVNDPRFALKVFGGIVKPKTSKALALPLKAEFKGLRPSTWGKDRFVFIANKKGVRVGWLAERKKNPDGSLRLAYRLVKQTEHSAQADAMPSAESVEKAALAAVAAFVEVD